VLRLHDPRRFGAVLWHDNDDGELEQHVLLRGLGVEPLEDGVFGRPAAPQTRKRSAPIKQVLLAGDIVVGVGNIYACESLFRAGINPKTPASRISRARYDKLAEAIREILAEAIVQGGSTLRDFIAVNGQSGYFQQTYFVYDRAGVPCRNCGGAGPPDQAGPAVHVLLRDLPEVNNKEADMQGFRTVQRLARRAWPTALEQYRGWVAGAALAGWRGRPAHRARAGAAGDDRLSVAFVAEFSRGKSELINAIFFADYGQRILPSAAGRTTMCPTELMYDPLLRACIRLLPIETRAERLSTSDYRATSRPPGPCCRSTSTPARMHETFLQVSLTRRVSVDEAKRYGLYDPDDPDLAGHARRRRPGRDPAVAPRHHQLPASAAQAGPGDPRHAGPERDRHRAGTDAEPDPERARGAVHPGRRNRRDQERHRSLAHPHRRRPGRMVVLNKIDACGTSCAAQENDAEIARQQASVAQLLGVEPRRCFRCRRRRRWSARSTSDMALFGRSRIGSRWKRRCSTN
jgi:hypothetical protein